jgi:hypothetical protein
MDQFLRLHHGVVDDFLVDVKIMLLKKSIHRPFKPGNRASSVVAVARNRNAFANSSLQIASRLGIDKQRIRIMSVDISHNPF